MGLTGLLHLPLYALGLLSPAARPEAPELSALLHAGKTSERLSAIQQLAKLPPTPEISESLVDALRDRDAGVVKTVAVLWGKIAAGHNSVYGESIPKAGRKHSEAEVDAARGKWIAWQKRLVAGLGWCVDSADPELSKAAARSLALMGEPVRGAFPSGRRCGNGLDIALWAKADHEFSVKTVTRETILRELLKDRDAQVVFGAFKQLYNETNRKWAKLQIPTLATDPRPDCRSMAAHYGSDETAAELIGDPDESVRWSAGWSIQRNPRVIAALMPRFQSETLSFRLGVLFLLERFVHDSYEDVIRLALLDSNSSVRAAGIEIAIERDMLLPEQYVVRNLRDSNPEVRCVTVPALRYLRSELARPLIAKLLMDSNDRIRNATVQYLENNSYVEAIPR